MIKATALVGPGDSEAVAGGQHMHGLATAARLLRQAILGWKKDGRGSKRKNNRQEKIDSVSAVEKIMGKSMRTMRRCLNSISVSTSTSP